MQVTLNLPESLAAHFQAQTTSGHYATPSDYIQALIEEDQAQKSRLETLALEGINSGPSTPMTPADWDHIRATIRQNLSRATQNQERTMSKTYTIILPNSLEQALNQTQQTPKETI